MKIIKGVLAMSMAFAGCATSPTLSTGSTDKKDESAGLKKYCVIDLTKRGGVEWLDMLIPSVNSDNTYKTTKLVLRRIDPGKFEYQPNKYISVTKPFYIGVFEVTQKQYELVCGHNPSVRRGARRPVENLSYYDLRGDHLGDQWPKSNKVDDETFIGKIRELTGMSFDLPTEAQWELACSGNESPAETVTSEKLLQQGKFRNNGGLQSHHDEVGSYRPNAFGLYDMFGNVWELCLDKREGNGGFYTFDKEKVDVTTDPKGSNNGNWRILRGASWTDSTDWGWPMPNAGWKIEPDNRSCANVGFRLCLNIEP